MADDKKNIGPEAEKPGEAPQEKKVEPIKDTPRRRSSRLPVRRRPPWWILHQKRSPLPR